MFTEKEIAYLRSQPLACLATISDAGQPDAVAVGFEFDGQCFYVGGHNLPATRKYKNIAAGHTKVALLIDDLPSVNPWSPRGIRIYGMAEIVERMGRLGPGTYFRITPVVSWSWNIEVLTSKENRFAVNKITHVQSA
ncbi:MAG: PPOX class F420-dependent oxidoreductase [Anaerolineales bacterium]